MKKNYSFYLTLVLIPFCAVLFLSFGGGQNQFYVSGSPSDVAENSPGNCALCHNQFPVMNDSPIITLTVPSEYDLNTTYPITVASSSAVARQGFQMSAEDGTNTKVGDFTDVGANTQAFVVTGNDRGEAITHTGAGGFQNTWTFNWTSPDRDLGPITFYAAVNETNSDFNTTGDVIHLKQSSANVLSRDSFVFDDLKMYPNPSQDYVTIELPTRLESETNLQIFDLYGKQIHEQGLQGVKTSIDVSKWQSGIYVIQLSNGNGSTSRRFIKQ